MSTRSGARNGGDDEPRVAATPPRNAPNATVAAVGDNHTSVAREAHGRGAVESRILGGAINMATYTTARKGGYQRFSSATTACYFGFIAWELHDTHAVMPCIADECGTATFRRAHTLRPVPAAPTQCGDDPFAGVSGTRLTLQPA